MDKFPNEKDGDLISHSFLCNSGIYSVEEAIIDSLGNVILNSPDLTFLQFEMTYPHPSLQQILWGPEVYPTKIWLRLFPAQAVFYHVRIRPDVLYRVGEEGDFL